MKLPLNAKSGVSEVWIVDLEASTVEAHRQPREDGYRHFERITKGRRVPAAFPDVELELTEILPPELPEPPE